MDLTGKSFGSLLVTSKSKERTKHGDILYNTKCACGTTKKYKAAVLPKRKSCGECKASDRTVPLYEERKKAKLRAGKKPFSSLPIQKQLKLINEYCFGSTVNQLSDKYDIDRISTRDGIKSYRERLNSIYELNYMASTSETKLPQETIDKALSTKLIEEKVSDLLSSEDSEDLTSSEMLYCYLFVNTGSNDTAIKESGFDAVLTTKSPIRRQLLGMYLRKKANLRNYIQVLQKDKLDMVKADKRVVQGELVEQVEQLKESVSIGGGSTSRGHLLRAIELLGKTVGAFEERVRVTEVNAADALDELLDMAKREAADIKELPAGSPVDETWEVPSE